MSGFLEWPTFPVTYGRVQLREFAERDVTMAIELASDPYVPLVTSLPAHSSEREAREWVDRQRGRVTEGVGFSFVITEIGSDEAVGTIGLWLEALSKGRATAGYSIVPRARGERLAVDSLMALTAFGWTIEALHRIELYIETWNVGSMKTAERAGYQREGLLRSHQEIGGERRDMLLYATVRQR